MSGLGALAVSWGPAFLKAMPHIIRVINGLSYLWSEIRKTKKEDDTVLKDPERRKLVMEGLVILMTKINKLDRHESDKQDKSGYHKEDDFSCSKWKSSCCRNGRSEMLASSCCEKGENELLTSSVTLSYEEQIEYAILLSRQDMFLKKEESAACSLSEWERQTFWSENSHENQYFSESQPFYENSSATCPDCHTDKESDELKEPVNSDCRNMANTCTSQWENAEDVDMQFELSLQEKEIQFVGQSHGSMEMIDSQFCQEHTSVPQLSGLSKKERKRRIKEQENMSIAIALSLSLEDAPRKDPPEASDSREVDLTK
ncbi:uncharacterized protein [Panulirus ornatus]|uniref:uncharacterized protein isoform X3 n=1 Tax=Panulirus ornatus TaxID=150431 RepID=UPI003A8799D2